MPWETIGADGNVITGKDKVLDQWSSEFGKLLTPPEYGEAMEKFICHIKGENSRMENETQAR